MSSELKPCPFCGNPAVLRRTRVNKPCLKCDEIFVQCRTCGARGGSHLDIRISIEEAGEYAIKSWNTRFPPKKSKKEIIQRNQEINQARKERLEKEKK